LSIQQLEAEMKRLSPLELAGFSKWLQKFAAMSIQNSARSDWAELSAEALRSAFSDSEPEYTLTDIKRR
jgi:hypothetical protein